MLRVRQDHYEAPDQKKRQKETCLTSRCRSSKFQERKRRSLKMMDRAHSRSGVLSASMLDMAHEFRLGRLQGVPEIHAGWVCVCVFHELLIHCNGVQEAGGVHFELG